MARTTKTTTRKPRSDKGKPRAKKAAASKVVTSGRLTEPTATKSVIKREYRERYGKLGTVGDEVATKLSAAVADAEGRTDAAKLRKLAEANGVWQDRYATMNVGMQRMNVGNRLRKLARDGATIKWGR